MKNNGLLKRVTACTLIMLLMIPFNAMSQQIEVRNARGVEISFTPEELEQILAPIALYPDALLAQVLAAATYPLEVVAADRFLKENRGVNREVLLAAARDRDWEPSVKAMLEFPDVLAMMDEQLEWTERLGDAFLAQPGDCMDAVQRLRQQAYAQGNLVTTGRQLIRIEPRTRIIIIEPARPEVVYVPVYDTVLIYGPWRHRGYPPYYFYPVRYSGISFLSGVFVGAFWGAWGTWDCNWHSRDVYINVGRYDRFTRVSYTRSDHYRSYNVRQGDQVWRYDARHRLTAGTRDSYAAQRSRINAPTMHSRTAVNADIKPRVAPAVASSTAAGRTYSQNRTISPTNNVREGARRTSGTVIKQRPAPAVKPRTTAVRAHSQNTVSPTTINATTNTRTAIAVSRSVNNRQAGGKQQPVRAIREKAVNQLDKKTLSRIAPGDNAAIQRNIKTSTSDSRVQKSGTLSVLTSDGRGAPKDRIFAGPASNDPRRNKDDSRAVVARGKEIRIQETNRGLPPDRRIPPSLKGSEVLREGPVGVAGP